METTDVLIVGAGPTGLVLGLWLTKAGIRVRIIDKAEKAGTTSRAIVMHARNLEFYRQMGVDQFALDRSVELKGIHLWLRGKPITRLPFGGYGAGLSAFPYILAFTQDLQEQMLTEELQKLGVEVQRNTELTDFEMQPDKVVAQLKKNGQTERSEARFLAGCDGAHSIVRQKLGIDFPGGTYSDIYYVADILATGPVVNGELNIALDDADFLAIFPMKGEGRVRLVGALKNYNQQPGNLKWEDVNQQIIERLKVNVKEVKWFSTYRVHHRVVSGFKKQNAFLLGDAAHLHSPVGGQGMNTGIGDAVNLAWKLAAVIKKQSPPSLLETYEPERIAFARKLVATTDRAFEFVSSDGPLANWLRLNIVPHLLTFLFQLPAVPRFMFRTISQIAIKYPQSALSKGTAGKVHGGDRLPWVKPENETTDNYSPLSSMQWQLHIYGQANKELPEFCKRKHLPLHTFPFNSTASDAGLKENAAYLIRPDGYVALAEPSADSRKIDAYLNQHGITLA